MNRPLPAIATSLVGLWLVLVCDLWAQSGIWLDVPFVKQEKKLCGAACISMVLQYWSGFPKHRVSMAVPSLSEVAQRVSSKQTPGVQGKDMERYFEECGYQVFVFRAEWSDLEHHLNKGRPLIVCVEGGPKGSPFHYIVLVGIDSLRGLVFANDPAQRKLLKLSQSSFERSWDATTRWTLLALPRLTASAID